MKKLLALLLALLTLLSLAACGDRPEELPIPDAPAAETPAEAPADEAETPAPEAETPAPEAETPAPEARPEPAPETPAPTPADPGVLTALTAQQQYEANIFLSNFAEQGFAYAGPFDAADADAARLFAFAHQWAKINSRALISYEGNFEVMTRSDYIDVVKRYFDLDEVPEPAEGEDFSAAFGMGRFDWDRVWYAGGRFYFPAADGESHTGFCVADEAYKLPDGNWRFRFTVYELDLDIYWDNNGIPGAYYRLTPAEAAQRAAKGEIELLYTGTAICAPYWIASSGRDSYRLVRYELDPTDAD